MPTNYAGKVKLCLQTMQVAPDIHVHRHLVRYWNSFAGKTTHHADGHYL